MAKENKKKTADVAKETEQMVNNPETINIEERIDNNRMIDEDIAELGDIQEKEEAKKRKIREYLECKNKALYFRDMILLTHAKTRRETHIMNDSIKKACELLEQLKGGKITPEDYDKAFAEFASESNKKFEASNKKFEEYKEKLQKGYPGYYSTQWELERIGLLRRNSRY